MKPERFVLAMVLLLAVVPACSPREGRPSLFEGQTPAANAAPAPWLYPVRHQGKWGFIDRTGRIAIEPRYQATLGFSSIDSDVLHVVAANIMYFQDVPVPEDNLTADSLAPVTLGGKVGYIDRTGRMVIAPTFAAGLWFQESLAAVNVGGEGRNPYVRGGKWGYIDRTGKMVIEPAYDNAWGFRNGVACVCMLEGGKRKYGYIDRSGRWILRPTPEEGPLQASEGVIGALVRVGKFGYFDLAGREVIPPQFLHGRGFFGGRAAVWVRDAKGRLCFGYIDGKGSMVIPPQFEYAMDFSEGLAAVNQQGLREELGEIFMGGGEWGFVDVNGTLVIPYDFADVRYFREGLAAVETFSTTSSGNPVETSRAVNGRIPSRQWGFIDKTGRMVIAPRFSYVFNGFHKGLARVTLGRRDCYIDTSGAVVWQSEELLPE
jgi:hypothetical protein